MIDIPCFTSGNNTFQVKNYTFNIDPNINLIEDLLELNTKAGFTCTTLKYELVLNDMYITIEGITFMDNIREAPDVYLLADGTYRIDFDKFNKYIDVLKRVKIECFSTQKTTFNVHGIEFKVDLSTIQPIQLISHIVHCNLRFELFTCEKHISPHLIVVIEGIRFWDGDKMFSIIPSIIEPEPHTYLIGFNNVEC